MLLTHTRNDDVCVLAATFGMFRSLFLGFGFNSGSALNLTIPDKGLVAANVAVATALSAAAGGISALFTNLILVERRTGEYQFVMLMATNGVLSGLVAVTSGCPVVEPWAAIVIGIVAGWVYLLTSALLERLRIDDAVNAIPVHMFNGMWGMLATGLLASPDKLELTYGHSDHPGLLYSFGQGKPDGTLLACQVVTLLMIAGWTLVTMLPFFSWLNYQGWFRSDSYEELVGLDISYHGGGMRCTVDNGIGIQFVEAHKRRMKETSERTFQNEESNSPNAGLSEGEAESRKTYSEETNHSSQVPNPLDDPENPLVAYDLSHEYLTSRELLSSSMATE
jgi:ammonia channel protein AmtB